MAEKITRALVTGPLPVFINGVLHVPGEVAAVDLESLGVDSLDDESVVGLKKHSAKTDEPVVQTPIAAVAPHAPDAPNPQGIPPGTVQSGTGRLVQVPRGDLQPALTEQAAEPEAIEPVGAEAPVSQEDRKAAGAETKQSGSTQKPSKPSK